MACEYDMYKIFVIPGDISKKTEWDGDIKKLKENKSNKLVILNRLLSAQYYPESKNRDGERYAIYGGTNITSWSYIHSGTVRPYKLDVEEFINYHNQSRFYRNNQTGACYFHDDASTHEYKDKYWWSARNDTIERKYLMCCDDLAGFVPLFTSSVGKGGAKKSGRRIKKIISRKKSQKNKTRSSRLG